MNDVNCPYCEAEQDIDHDDGYGFGEDVLYQQQCSFCEKYFTYRTRIVYYHETFKAGCLNGEKHKYEPTHTFPKEFTRMRCTECDEERSLTDEERKILNVPEHSLTLEGKKDGNK